MSTTLFKYGFVRLDAHEGSDLSVVNSARVSFGKRSDKMGPAEVGLVNYLMHHRHGTPFEHNMFRFHIKAPLFCNREWFRHRIGSFNEESSRYSEMQPHFYVPTADYVRSQVGKPGAYTYEQSPPEVFVKTQQIINDNNHDCYERYTQLLQMGVAREVARDVLTVSIFSEFYWTVNARSLMNFLGLRNANATLRELRDYAKLVEIEFAANMPVTYSAWVENSRVAP